MKDQYDQIDEDNIRLIGGVVKVLGSTNDERKSHELESKGVLPLDPSLIEFMKGN